MRALLGAGGAVDQAVKDHAGRGWRGVDLRPASVRHLQQLRHDLHGRARLEPDVEATTNPISAPGHTAA